MTGKCCLIVPIFYFCIVHHPIQHCFHTGGGGYNFVRGLFQRGKFRRPCKSQSLHCLVHTVHCQSPQISRGKISPPSLKTKFSHEKLSPPLYLNFAFNSEHLDYGHVGQNQKSAP